MKLRLEFTAAIVTVIVGYLGAAILAETINWPDGGSVIAIAVMGAFILRRLDHNGSDE